MQNVLFNIKYSIKRLKWQTKLTLYSNPVAGFVILIPIMQSTLDCYSSLYE